MFMFFYLKVKKTVKIWLNGQILVAQGQISSLTGQNFDLSRSIISNHIHDMRYRKNPINNI